MVTQNISFHYSINWLFLMICSTDWWNSCLPLSSEALSRFQQQNHVFIRSFFDLSASTKTISSRERAHIPPWEKPENHHLQKVPGGYGLVPKRVHLSLRFVLKEKVAFKVFDSRIGCQIGSFPPGKRRNGWSHHLVDVHGFQLWSSLIFFSPLTWRKTNSPNKWYLDVPGS